MNQKGMSNMEIIQKFLTINKYSRTGEKMSKIEDIVVHWVGNANTSALANRNYFENLRLTHTTYASSQFIIGLNGEILQLMPENEVAFHAGNKTENRKSIGIECCHPDWTGKFTNATYNSLVNLCVYLCKKYNIKVSNLKRHYDITGKVCPKYFVEYQDEWNKFKQDVTKRLRQEEKPKEEEFEMAKTYKNGSTSEPVYADTSLTTKTGSLDKYETCECLAIVEGRYLVKYKVNGKNVYKTGFVKYSGGIK